MAEGFYRANSSATISIRTVDDPVNARQIINGNDQDTLIAGYYEQFRAALNAAAMVPPKPASEPAVVHVNIYTQSPPSVSIEVSVNGEMMVVG